MIDRDALRRLVVFALLFGGAMGLLVWRAGGLRARLPAAPDAPDGPAGPAPPGAVAEMAPGIGVGASVRGTLAHDTVHAVGGRPVRYRAWAASWDRSTPRPPTETGASVQDVTGCRIALFPAPDDAAPRAVEGSPDSTRIAARQGVLTHQPGVRTTARLEGDVTVERFLEDDGGVVLRTRALDCDFRSAEGRELRSASSDDAVSIDGRDAHVEGTGLDADLAGEAFRATIRRDVRARFVAARGSFTAEGGAPGASAKPVDVTCSGACEIAAPGRSARGASRRWRATFRDDVRVVQEGSTLACDVLEVDFEMGRPGSRAGVSDTRLVAAGRVRVDGRLQSGRSYVVTADKASRWTEGPEGRKEDVALFEGSPVLALQGSLTDGRGRPGTPDAAARGRMEIRCAGPVTMRGRYVTPKPGSAYRTTVVFEDDVVARQWDDETASEPTAVLRAPRATLFGTKVDAADSSRWQPDTMTAEGGVDLRRADLTAKSAALTWQYLAEQQIDRTILSGSPVVTFAGGQALQPFAKARSTADGNWICEAKGDVKVDRYREAPPAAGAPPRPYAVITAQPGVVIRQMAGDEEVYRLTSEQVEATIAADRQLELARAWGDAHLRGRGGDGRTRDVHALRIQLVREVPPAGAAADAPRPAQVSAFGDDRTPARALIREADGRGHEVRAQVLQYKEQGVLLTASRDAVATLDVAGVDEKQGAAARRMTAGSVTITAQEVRAELAPQDSSAAAAGNQLLRVTATERVVLDGKLHRVTGDRVTYDAVTGIAEVVGRPARVVSLADSERYTSFVNAGLVRAYFDTSTDPQRRGQLVRASCQTGAYAQPNRIVRYVDPPDAATGRPREGTAPRRAQVSCTGPVEVTRTEATAMDDVIAVFHSMDPRGQWSVQEARLDCARAYMTFDPDAQGEARERIRSFSASGTDALPVRVETPQFTGTADRVEVAGSSISLSSGDERRVYVRELRTGRQFFVDRGTWDFETKEWSGLERLTETE